MGCPPWNPPSRGVTPLWTPQNGVRAGSQAGVFAPLTEPEAEGVNSLSLEWGFQALMKGVKEGHSPSLSMSSPSPLGKGAKGIGPAQPNTVANPNMHCSSLFPGRQESK